MQSNPIFSQNTNTKNTNCYSDEQVAEIFKGLRQNDYLKIRLSKTESALDNADAVIQSQKKTIAKYGEESSVKDNLIATNEELCNQDKEILNLKIQGLHNELNFTKSQSKKDSRKSLWKGIKIGGISAAILTTATIIFIQK